MSIILSYQALVSAHYPGAYCMMEDCLTFILKEQAQRICSCNGSKRLIEFMPAIDWMNPISLDDFYSSWTILESKDCLIGNLWVRATSPGLCYIPNEGLPVTGFEPIEVTLNYQNDNAWKKQ